MSFLSFDFLLAASLALAAFYSLPLRWRPGFLLASLCRREALVVRGLLPMPIISSPPRC